MFDNYCFNYHNKSKGNINSEKKKLMRPLITGWRRRDRRLFLSMVFIRKSLILPMITKN